MRVLFLLIGFFVAGLSAWQNEYAEPKPIDFGDNIAYRYHYSGYVLTGLPHINQQQSGYQVISEVFLTKDDQGWIVMKFVDPKLSKVHGIIPEDDHLYFAQDSGHDFVREISKPVRFQLKNGVFTSLEAGKDDPFWSVNMKKSVIDILQVDLKPQKVIYESSRKSVSLDSPTERLVHYSTYEDGIKGVCETTYERFRTSDPKNLNYYKGSGFFALNLTKTRNYRNCLHESMMIRHNLDKVRCSSRCQSSLRMNEFDQFEDSYLPKSERLSRSTYGCECDSKAKPSPVEQFSTVRYNITYETEIPHIEGIIADGKMYIDNHGYNFVVKTHQNLSLIETKRTSYASIVSGSRVYRLSDDVITYNSLSYKIWDPIMDRKPFLDIPYYHLFFYPEQEELVEAAKKHLDQIVEDIIAGGVEESKKLTYKINKLTEILGFLDVPHFDDFFKTHVDIQEDSSLSSIRRQIFFDLLPYAGTNHAALFIGKLIEAKKIDEWEIRSLVESLPKNLYHPSREVVEKYFELVSGLHAKATSGHFQIITPLAVSWAKMVKTLCGNGASGYHGEQLNSMFVKPSGRKDRSNDPRARFNSFVRHSFNFNCTVEDVHRYADTVNGWMESDVSFDLKLVWGQVLSHVGNGYALNLLKPHLSGSNYGFTHYHTADYNLPNQNMSKQWEEYNFFRTALIYALHNVVDTFPTLLKTMTLPIFRNHGEPYELRLAAFTLFLVSGPEQHELESVATVLKYEHNHQVINMVRSLLHNAANLTSPCNQHLARAAHNVLLSLPKYEFDRGDHSNANWNEWYSEDKHTGINFNWQYVANNMSQVPRGGYFNMGSSWGPYQNSWLTIAYQQKGFEGFMRKIFNRYNLKDIFRIHGKLSSPPIKFTPRLDETPRAKIFFKIFEKTSLFIIDQDMATQALSVLEHRYQLLKNNLTSGSNYHVVKIILPHMYQSLIPSDIGLPVHVSKSHPLVMSLKIVNAKVETTSGSTPSVNLTANITPQMWYSAVTSVSVINTAVREAAGVLTTKRTIVGLPMRISAGYVPKYNLFTYSWMPEMGKTVLFHRNSIVSFQSYVQVDLDPRQSPLTKETQILSMPAPYIHRDFYGHPLIGMGLRFKSMSDRPQFGKTPLLWVSKLFNNWYSSNGLIPYILQSYTEFSSYFHHVVVQLEQYVENPVQGFYGTFKYNWLYSLDDLVTSNVPNVERRGLRESSMNEKRDHKKAHKIIHHLRRGFSSNEIDDLVWEIDDKLDEDYRFNQYEDVAGKIVKHYLSKKEFEKIVHNMINKTRDVWYTKGVSKDIMPSTFSQLFAWSLMTYGSKPAQFAGSLVWSQTLNKQITWYKLDHLMESQWNPIWEQIPSFTSLEAVIKYANYPNELFWNPSSQKTFGNKMRWTIGWGDEYPVQRLVINGTMEKVLDTIFWPENFGSFSTQDFAMTPNTYSIEPWFEHQCKLDVARNHQLSPACLKAIYNNARFNKINFHIKHHDIPEQLVRSAEIFEQFFRAMYFPWLNLSSLAEQSYLDDAVKITLEHSTLIPNSPVMNVRLMTPNGVRSYEKLPAIVDKFPSVYPPYYGQLSWPKKNIKTCSVSKSAITTFDNFTYELPHRSLQACSHVLAMDCSPENRFSVVLEPSKERRDLNAHTLIISLGSDEIKLVRVQKSNEETYFQVHANGIDFQVKDCEPFVLHPESVSSLKIWKESVENGLGFVAVLEAPKQHVRIVTDGEGLLKIETGFDYVGKTCGLCGNSDHEVDMELEGPDRCVYDRFEDFIMSYSIGCSKSGYPKGPVRCVDRETSWPWTSNVKPIKVLPKTEAYPVVKKNLIRYSDDKKCFSSRPLAHCPEGFYPKEVEEKMIRFTCFDRADPMADEYEREIFDNHSIGSLYNSKESDKHKVQVPIRCIAKQVEPKVIKSIY